VMQIVQRLAGYSLGRADLVRRAMSKKKQHVMEVERKNFIEGIPEDGVPGCVGNGIPADIAGRIYDSMMDFAKYAFNKSHAACYAVVAMQTAYLKAHYPVEFMAALMTSVIDMTGKLAGYIGALGEMGIRLAPPDINSGGLGFRVIRNAEGVKEIRYALTAVRGVGRGLVMQIVKERGERGPYRSFQDFCRRMAGTELNRRALENMIKAGAFDSLGGTRRGYLLEHAAVLDQAQQEIKDNVVGQMSLFDMMGGAGQGSLVTGGNARTVDTAEFDKEQLLMQEREVLGVYVSGHPLDEETAFLKKHASVRAADFMSNANAADDAADGNGAPAGNAGAEAPGEESGPTVKDRERVVAGGMITGLNQRYTKAGQPMATFALEDLTGSVEVIIFPKCFAEYGAKLREDARVLVRGRATVETDADARLIAEDIRLFSEVPRRIWIQFPDRAAYDRVKDALHDLFAGAHADRNGNDTCTVYLRAEKQKAQLDDSLSVKADKAFLADLKDRFGEENVKLV
ncbi:MAG: DNA polymerase III subunit alpha, partial [Lachnospiraceae bacterium]|nr:DNA polymerase III subunit alpha [Lachnospiraceae bacterium]